MRKNLEALLSPDELEENKRKLTQLLELLRSGEAILMAGAGCSASLHPDWPTFIAMLQEAAIQQDADFSPYTDDIEDFLLYADRVKNCIGNERFHNVIFQQYKPHANTHERFHEVLCRFLIDGKLKGITTTNYDIGFESALASVTGGAGEAVRLDAGIAPAKIFEFLFSLNNGGVPKRILHWHGTYDVPLSLILSGSEYQASYGFKLNKPLQPIIDAVNANMSEGQFADLLSEFGLVWTRHRKLIYSLFATRRLIFMGFSFNDPYFLKMLETISDDLHSYGYDNHYLVQRLRNTDEKLGLFQRAREMKDRYGIETVFFEENAGKTGLSNFIFELENLLYPLKNPLANPSHEQTIEAEADQGDIDLTNYLIEVSRKNDHD